MVVRMSYSDDQVLSLGKVGYIGFLVVDIET